MVSTVVYDGICGAPIVFDYLCVISLGRFVLMRMVLHCTAAAKHMRFGAGDWGALARYELFHVLLTA